MTEPGLHRFAFSLTVQPQDIDDLGHVNNAVYLQYVESCIRAHADHVGMSLDRMRELGTVPVARRHVIHYHRPALLGEALTVSTEIKQVSGLRARRHNEVRRAQDGALLVDVNTDWVWVDPVRGRPRPVVAAIVQAFGGERQEEAG